ncbi:uncharacterized protein LOC132935644 isoform X1 [Metopolophium dirhodum]|uniref:uncharacterized protein LOC132935644 isoform X1 n=2 Tax=Metopolophium dirhodum TaxID=44670 RepID=UPI00298F4BEC|nr:uncharacterized protein LOC132935644 isoform X1 [Metopolophium dirhodum]
MSRPTLMKTIENDFQELSLKMKFEMSKCAHIATTADGWSIFKKSYIGITVTWINEDLSRSTRLLALRRLEGSHTYDILAKAMDAVYTEFEISDKLSYCTTDNGSNFVKCFKTFGHIFDDENTDTLLVNDAFDDDLEEIDAIDLNILNDKDDHDLQYVLPKHHRCCAHTINLIATMDSKKALSNPAYKKQSRSTFAKSTALWNKQGRSTKSADLVKQNLGVYLITPNETRWNSLYDAVVLLNKLIRNNETKFRIIMDELSIGRFNRSDIDFMCQYQKIMGPISISLDLLQGDTNMYFGHLLPTIEELIYKYELMTNDVTVSNYMKPLVNAILNGIKTRFADYLIDKFLIVAAVCHPLFKTAWIKNDTKKQLASEYFKNACYELDELHTNDNDNDDVEDNQMTDNLSSFFTWSQNSREEKSTVSDEIDRFLGTSPTKTLECLHNLPTIKRVFVKYNTPLPSSASVERVFSVGGATITKKRTNMTDKHFEEIMFLKCNTQLFD